MSDEKRCPECDRVTCPRMKESMPDRVRSIFQSLLNQGRPPTRWEAGEIAAYQRDAEQSAEDCRLSVPDWKARAMAVRRYVSTCDDDLASAWKVLTILDGDEQ